MIDLCFISEAGCSKNASLVNYESEDTEGTEVTLSENEDDAEALRKKAAMELREGKYV